MTTATVLFCVACILTPALGVKHIKIFVLAGDISAQGRAPISSLKDLIDDPTANEKYQHLVDSKGNWKQRDYVYITYDRIVEHEWMHAPWSADMGYGFTEDVEFGPELVCIPCS
jgi:hypothetical protein